MSRRLRSSATTRPRPWRLRASSKPTWPFTPVSKIVACFRVVIQPSSREMLGVGQALAGRILRGQQRLEVNRPLDADRGIVPDDAALMLGKPVVRSLVEKLGGFRQHHETVRETRRHP